MRRNSIKKLVIVLSIVIAAFTFSQTVSAYEVAAYHTVKPGDTFWILSREYGVDMQQLMDINNADENTVIYVGQVLKIPKAGTGSGYYYTVKPGDTFWIISNKLGVSMDRLIEVNNMTRYTILYPGDRLLIPYDDDKVPILEEGQKPWVTYDIHTVRSGDDFWKLSLKYGVPMKEIIEANGMTENTILKIGQKLKIPVHHVPVKPTPGERYGEYLDWWTEAQYVWPIGKNAVIKDFYTGKTWSVRRTIGAFHADVEPLTVADTQIMKQVWGGEWSWVPRPVIVLVEGRKIAASASAMPHSVSYINGNCFPGHFDVHFKNSTRHKDNEVSEEHQKAVKTAAGI